MPCVALPEEQCYTRKRSDTRVTHDRHGFRSREGKRCQARWKALKSLS